MTVNKHDGYEALAKLLYPSIEASGNVYYGQTRKLTLDAVLDRNDLGFESYTHTKDNKNYFSWRLLSFFDSIQIDTDKYSVYDSDIVTYIKTETDESEAADGIYKNTSAYVKYKIIITDSSIDNTINSQTYRTYEKNLDIEKDKIYICEDDISPIDGSKLSANDQEKQFFVELSQEANYIYVKVCTGIIRVNAVKAPVDHGIDAADFKKITAAPQTPYIKFIAVGGDVELSYSLLGNITQQEVDIGYVISGNFEEDQYNPYDRQISLNAGEIVVIKENDFIAIRIDSIGGETKDDTIRFNFSGEESAKVMCVGTLMSGKFSRLFENCDKLLKAPVIDTHSAWSADFLYRTFYGCSSLKEIEFSGLEEQNPDSFNETFAGCSSIESIIKFPIMPHSDSINMFGTDEASIQKYGSFTVDSTAIPDVFYTAFNVLPKTWAYKGNLLALVSEENTTVTLKFSEDLQSMNDWWQPAFKYQDNANDTFADTSSVPWNDISFDENNSCTINLSADKPLYIDFALIVDPDYNNPDGLPKYKLTDSSNKLSISFGESAEHVRAYGKLGTEYFVNYQADGIYEYYFYHSIFKNASALIKAPDLYLYQQSDDGQYATALSCKSAFEGTSITELPNIYVVPFKYELRSNVTLDSTFKNCKNLNRVDVNFSDSLISNAVNNTINSITYNKTFENCSNLTLASIATVSTQYETVKYINTFDGCTSLNKVYVNKYYDTDFREWINYENYVLNREYNLEENFYIVNTNTISGTLFSLNNYDWKSCIPPTWSVKKETDSSTYISTPVIHTSKANVLLTSGTNNSSNGRGDINDPDTLSNMEKSFDENKTHQMNTHNEDGSFNQEIWGYKSFNSPVQFRNGIYCERSSIIALDDDSTVNDITVAYSVDSNVTNPTVYDSTVADGKYTIVCSAITNKNSSIAISNSIFDSIAYKSIFVDPLKKQHNLEYTLENCAISQSEINTKVENNIARVYTRVMPNVDLKVNSQYRQDIEQGNEYYIVTLDDHTQGSQCESCISANSAFVKVTGGDTSSSAAINADNVSVNNVLIMPSNHAGEETSIVFNNGGLYLLALDPIEDIQTQIVLNCGSIIKANDVPGVFWCIPYNDNTIGVRLGTMNFTKAADSSVSTSIHWHDGYTLSGTTTFKLLSPTVLSSNTDVQMAFAICIKE